MTASNSTAWVEYLIDDQLKARVVEAPYSFEWDSEGTLPGDHRLTVKATDTVGNEGQINVSFKVLPLPPVVEIFTSLEEVKAGGQLSVGAKVASQSEIAWIDFLVDGSAPLPEVPSPELDPILTLR